MNTQINGQKGKYANIWKYGEDTEDCLLGWAAKLFKETGFLGEDMDDIVDLTKSRAFPAPLLSR